MIPNLFKVSAEQRGQSHMLLGDREVYLLIQIFKATEASQAVTKKGLEIGTLVGQTTYLLGQMNQQKKWITLEKDIELVQVASHNFKQLGVQDQFQVVSGDALLWLQQQQPVDFNNIDFVFVDANKGAYLAYWQQLVRLLPSQAIVIFDNLYLNLTLRDFAQQTFCEAQKGFAALSQMLPDFEWNEGLVGIIDENKHQAKPRWSARVQSQMQELILQLSQQTHVALMDQGDGLCVVRLN